MDPAATSASVPVAPEAAKTSLSSPASKPKSEKDGREGATYDDEQGGYKFPSDATLPDISLAVGETLYKLNPKDIAFGDAGDGYMFGGIQSRGNLDFDILGDVALKSIYAVSQITDTLPAAF